ncbi:MAG: flagellar motor protein MotB [Hungatella sp.]
MNKKSRPTDGGGNWMDTYGDMVTLLLTFFVMLYSMSNVDAQKWDVFVKSVSPENTEKSVEEILINSQVGETQNSLTGQTLGDAEIAETLDPTDVDTLYLMLAEELNEAGVENATLMRGDDYTYVRFENSTFFDGNSSLITSHGKQVLDLFCESIAPAAEGISQINVMAHTAKADVNRKSDLRTDRILSAMRAAEVSIYIQQKEILDPAKLVDISYGEFRPIADNSIAEGRAKNRRVEFILLDQGAKERGIDQYYSDLKSGSYDDTTVITTGKPAGQSENE